MIGQTLWRHALPCVACIALVSCTTVKVDTIRLTLDKHPPKEPSQVRPLAKLPADGFEEIADLTARGDSVDFEKLQKKILERAAELGADAVVFSTGQEHVKEGVTYRRIYRPWGYYDPYYGPDPWGYGDVGYGGLGYGSYGYMAQPYEIRINSLKGTAIRYTGSSSRSARDDSS